MIDWLRGASARHALDPEIDLGGRQVPIVLKRLKTARRLTLRLAPDGSEVRITLPAWAEVVMSTTTQTALLRTYPVNR